MDTLIERYLAAVSDLLPASHRKDTVIEIRSLIQDALDDRSKSEGRPVDEAMTAEVLKQFGPPKKIVAPYLPERYLIGPHLFPTFILVLQIALPIIAALSLVGFWAGYNYAGPITEVQLLTDIIKSLGGAFTAILSAFGNIVLIFAILQWAIPEFRMPVKTEKEEQWDPHTLKAISQPDRIKRGELITEIFFSMVGLIIITFYLGRGGLYIYNNGQWVFTSVLTSTFTRFIPWIDLLLVVNIILDIILLRRGAWELGTRLFSIALYAGNIALAAGLLVNVPYLYTLQGALGMSGVEGMLQSLLNQVLIFVFIIVIIVNSVRILTTGVRIIRSSLARV